MPFISKALLILARHSSGDPEVDQVARTAGNLGDRPLVVLTAGQYWKPDDPTATRAVAQFHEIWMHQLQPELARRLAYLQRESNSSLRTVIMAFQKPRPERLRMPQQATLLIRFSPRQDLVLEDLSLRQLIQRSGINMGGKQVSTRAENVKIPRRPR